MFSFTLQGEIIWYSEVKGRVLTVFAKRDPETLEGERHKTPIADGKQRDHFMVGERGDEASTP